MSRLLPVWAALLSPLAAALIFGRAAQAEVQKFLNPCGGQRLCASYKLIMTPPDGWVLDKDATAENHMQIIVPKGKNFSNAPALIYMHVFYHADKTQALADFAQVSNARWLAGHKSAKISELPTVERANGKPAFLRFAFENPDQPQQAYEVGALGLDADNDGNEFVLDIVMTGAAKKALDRADKDYVAFLKAN